MRIYVTEHALKRAQHRGVQPPAIKYAVEFGQTRRLPGGSTLRMLTSRALAEVTKHHDLPAAHLDRMAGTVVITNDAGSVRFVTTTLCKEKREGLHKVIRQLSARHRHSSHDQPSMVPEDIRLLAAA